MACLAIFPGNASYQYNTSSHIKQIQIFCLPWTCAFWPCSHGRGLDSNEGMDPVPLSLCVLDHGPWLPRHLLGAGSWALPVGLAGPLLKFEQVCATTVILDLGL